jgi:hypothetical protein
MTYTYIEVNKATTLAWATHSFRRFWAPTPILLVVHDWTEVQKCVPGPSEIRLLYLPRILEESDEAGASPNFVVASPPVHEAAQFI